MSRSLQPWLHELVTALHAPTVVLSEPGGQIRPAGAQGVLHADTRVLSAAVLEVGQLEPDPVSGGLLTADRALFIGAARQLGDEIPDPTVRVEREREVSPGRVRETIRIISAAAAPVHTELTLRVAADLASMGEIKSGQAGRAAGGSPEESAAAAGAAAGAENGTGAADGARAGAAAGLSWGAGPVAVQFRAPGASVNRDGDEYLLSWPVQLGAGGRQEVSWELTVQDPAAVVAAAPDQAGSGELANPWAEVRASSDDQRLPRLLSRAMSDAAALRMTTAQAPGDVFLAGGAPWYLTLFGRDSIWSARLMLPFGWQLAAGTLRTLAALQGTRLDATTGEAPGKIPHELRTAGRQGENGLPALYYGTIDATPLWICLLHDAWRWGMPAAEVRALLPSLHAALAYLRDYGDADGDGFLEYIDDSGRGLANQGWKDSGNAIRFASGTIAKPPVALCEVQGYAYEAASRAADLLDALGEPGGAQWRVWAGRLAAAFRAAFWVPGEAGAYPALALDAGKRPVDSLTSNIGHLLGTGLLSAAEEDQVTARLMGPDMNSGFGLRTMSSASGGYSPFSYHCGSVWAHDTAIVIGGLARSGHPAEARSLASGLLDAAAAFGWRLPELFAGDARTQVPWPSPYPASCRPQAWAAAAAGALVIALLGLEVDVPAGRVSVSPLFPDQAGTRLQVEGLVAGNETFSAGIDVHGRGYLRGLSAALAPASPARS
ncbi:MAG TPA: glycogen debranching N-terminal domain-containing protein [Streptosporangiaceae bacterium]|nr:glycogen debranching N-terminal domain-containing protein [Streptosporangiaceae bacterium]